MGGARGRKLELSCHIHPFLAAPQRLELRPALVPLDHGRDAGLPLLGPGRGLAESALDLSSA